MNPFEGILSISGVGERFLDVSQDRAEKLTLVKF